MAHEYGRGRIIPFSDDKGKQQSAKLSSHSVFSLNTDTCVLITIDLHDPVPHPPLHFTPSKTCTQWVATNVKVVGGDIKSFTKNLLKGFHVLSLA